MLLSMMVILAITSTILELMIAARVPIWRKLSYKYPLFNLVNSLFLSFIVGIAFGANGLVALGAGVISTILSFPGYKFLHYNYDSEEALLLGKSRYAHFSDTLKVTIDKWRSVLKDFFKVVYIIVKIITLPIIVVRYMIKGYKIIIDLFVSTFSFRKRTTS